MARTRNSVPSYQHHSSGGARVRTYHAVGKRVEIVLPGKYGSDESKQEYERILSQLRAGNGKLPPTKATTDLTVAELVKRFMEEHVEIHYRRGRTLDVHALRTTFGTLLSKGGVAPRTAQEAMRHSDIRMTMKTYTDPKLLDVHGALDALPALPLRAHAERQSMAATGTDGKEKDSRQSPLAPTQGKLAQKPSFADKMNTDGPDVGESDPLAVTLDPVKRKDPLTMVVNGSDEWALRGSNPRPHGCDPCALAN